MSQHYLKVFKALSDQTRLDMVMYLWREGEVPCRRLSEKFQLSQPTLSHHFNKLINADILKVRKQGVTRFYEINKNYLISLGINLKSLNITLIKE
jgi:DNA-binding transcriptional ArsR family regulator